MKCITLFLFSLLGTCVFGQDTVVFTANIKDRDFNTIAYSSIELKNKPEIYTVSGRDGYFELQCLHTDTLVIRQAGYKKVEQSIKVIVENEIFQRQRIIILADKVQDVAEVNVSTKKRKIRQKNYGNRSKDKAFYFRS